MKNYLLSTKFLRGALSACALVAVLSVLAPASQAASRWVTLEAIHQIENPRNLTRPGPFGELGPYQFRAATWTRHTRRPFSDALDRRWADMVAVLHYEWVCERLEQNGLESSVYNVALAWNAGVSAAIRGSAPSSSHNYAARVCNIAEVLNGRALVATQ